MQNIETKTEETQVEYLRRLAADHRDSGRDATAADIEQAAARIAELETAAEGMRHQIESADAAATRKSQELDAILSPLFSAMESRIEGIIADEMETFRRDFDISDYQSDIEYMLSDQIGEAIDDRLPEPETEEDRQQDVENMVRDILAGATVTIDI